MICIQLCHRQLPCHRQLYPQCLNIILYFDYFVESSQYYSIMQEIFDQFVDYQSSLNFPSKNCFSHDFGHFLHCLQSLQSFSCLQRPLDVSLNNPNILNAILDPSMSNKLSDCPLNIFY